jgi:hypothetical protein
MCIGAAAPYEKKNLARVWGPSEQTARLLYATVISSNLTEVGRGIPSAGLSIDFNCACIASFQDCEEFCIQPFCCLRRLWRAFRLTSCKKVVHLFPYPVGRKVCLAPNGVKLIFLIDWIR